MLRSAATVCGTNVPARIHMKQRTIGNEATTPAASANSLYARRCIKMRRHSASGVRLFKG